MLKTESAKAYCTELDIYERRFVSENGFKYVKYSEKYVNGFLGKKPPVMDTNIDFSEYQNVHVHGDDGNLIISQPPKTYSNICTGYSYRLIVLFNRIKKDVVLKTPSKFRQEDLVDFHFRIIKELVTLPLFLQRNKKLVPIIKGNILKLKKYISEHPEYKNLYCRRLMCFGEKIYLCQMI